MKNFRLIDIFRKNGSGIFAMLFFVLTVWGACGYVSFKRGQWKKEIRGQALEQLIAKKSNLEKSLFSRIFYTRSVAAYVAQKPGITNKEYDLLAKGFIRNDTVICTMSLSKNCVISAVYPQKGHEKALGLNLLEHPKRKEIVEKTIETRKTFVAGPVELVEGGIAFISYTPIFDMTKDSAGNFWGVTDIVIYRDKLLNEAALKQTDKNFRYALRGYDGTGAQGSVFWGDPKVFRNSPVVVDVELPNGTWQLASVPVNGWSACLGQSKSLMAALFLAAFILSAFLFILLKAFNRIMNNDRELKAIFQSLDALTIEFDKNGEYLKVAPSNLNLLILPQKEIIGKKIPDIFDKEKTQLFMEAIKKCLQTKKVEIIDYPLEIRGENKWFRARISYKSTDSVIYTAYDVTKNKLAEEKLKESESRLKKLNTLKDYLFSILAHDLRNPIGSFRNITKLLLEEADQLSERKKAVLVKSIYDTSVGLSDLIDNLLSWAQSQQNLLHIDIKKGAVFPVCKEVIASQATHAMVKKIKLCNEIDPNIEAFFDDEITKIILRNLISNAIKYSYRDTEIVISSELIEEKNGVFVLIHITDHGCGISASRIDQLFCGVRQTTKGTNNEKGSGLGLILCKNFVEMQNGCISVTSEEGTGSTFTFSLPVCDKG